MTSTTAREPLQPGAGPNGWLAFSSIILFLNGFFGAFWGLTAILNENIVTVGGKGVVIWDFTAWGWIVLIISIVMVLTSVGLVLGKPAARWLAVVFTTAHALAQFGSLPAFPLWSILLISLDVVILYNLFVRWQLTD